MTNQQPTPPPNNTTETNNFYTERQDAKRQRMTERADKLRTEGQQNAQQAIDFFRQVNGQPMLPDHYSYKSDRNRRERHHNKLGRGVEQQRRADELETRAQRVGHGGIASDDPEAITQLRHKIEALTETRDALKADGAAYRKARNAEAKKIAGTWDITPKEAQRIIETADWRLNDDPRKDEINTARTRIAEALQAEGIDTRRAVEMVTGNGTNQFGVPSFEITSYTNRIKTATKRIEELETLKIEDPEWNRTGTFSDGTEWEATLEEGRYRIRSTKPSREVTQQLRRLGFNWSRTETAWQLKTTPRAQQQITSKLDQLGATRNESQA